MPRSRPEWIADDDTPVPPRIKIRVKLRADSRCEICGVRAERGEVDHIEPLIFSTEKRPLNRESNLRWLCINDHRAKTATDVALKSRTAKTQIGVAGVKPKSWLSKQYQAAKARGYNPWTRKVTTT